MKILILDPIPNVQHRISKDTSGGYGTGNDFGEGFVSKYLKKKLKKIHDWPPLFAAYTFSVLKEKGNEVTYASSIPNNISNYDLCILTSSIVCCETECMQLKKITSLGIKCFVIGPFASNNPEKYLEFGGIVVSGEPEFYFIKDIDFKKIEKSTVVKFETEHTLDDLPYPDWPALMINKKASTLFDGVGSNKSIPILGTRGCPFSCFKYCVYPLQQGRKVRQRDPKKIVDEIYYWKKNYGFNMFIFRDPVFSINRKHTIEFSNELIKRNIKIKFIIETHLKILDTELIQILKKAGLSAVKVGIESADENVLKEANRFTVKKDEQLEKIRELEKNNILISSMFIIAFPTDSETSIAKTLAYAKKLNTTYAQFSVWTPYPGTPIFHEYKDQIIVDKYENYDQYNLVYKHKNLSKEKVRNLLSKVYSDYYLRISWIFKYVYQSFKNI